MTKFLFRSLMYGFFCYTILYFFMFKEVGQTVLLDRSGQSYVVPESEQERQPKNTLLGNLDIDAASMYVETPLCVYGVLSKYASLTSVQYKDIKQKNGGLVNSLIMLQKDGMQVPSLLLAVGNQTSPVCPEFYLKNQLHDQSGVTLTYEARSFGWLITKVLTFSNNSYKVNMGLSFEPLFNDKIKQINPRIIFAAPVSDEQLTNTPISCFVNNESLKGLSYLKDDVLQNNLWKMPYLCGAMNRFFLHSFLGSKSDFYFKRCFFEKVGLGQAIFMELWPVKSSTVLDFDFYFGPKKFAALAGANSDLTSVLTSSILSPIYKFLIWFLEGAHRVVGNYGWAIFLLALFLKLLFFPISLIARRRLYQYIKFDKEHSAAIADINRRFASSIIMRGEQISKYYDAHNMSQFGRIISQMAPLALQLFSVFCLYRSLVDYVVFYNAPAFWITDLSSYDSYFILPVLLGITSLGHQYLINMYVMAEDNGNSLTKFLPPVLFALFFYKVPAGALLFWTFNNTLSIFESLIFKFIVHRDV